MPQDPNDPVSEVRRLQHCMNDLVSVLALPAVWSGSEPRRILETLLDALLGTLGLDFLYGEARVDAENIPIQVLRTSPANRANRDEIQQALQQWLGDSTQRPVAPIQFRVGNREAPAFSLQMGIGGELGLLVAGSSRPGFPQQTERLVLSVAANQAAIGLQQALLLNEQKRVSAELDHRVSQRTLELAETNHDLKKEIAERKEIETRLLQSEEQLRSNERNLSTIINTMPVLAWSALPDGTVEFFNQRWLDYTGLSSRQACGWGWTQVVHPEDIGRMTAYWQSVIATGEPGGIEARFRRFDGEYRWFLARVDPLRDPTGAIVKWYGTNTDIDDRKRAEEELRTTQSELARMTRVVTVGQLTASIAHEVSQPISGIITNASTCLRMLNNDPPNVEGARETVQRTIRDGNRATDVIVRLRSLFSKNKINFEPVDLNDAAREVIALLSSEFQKDGVMLLQQFTERLPPVMGDRVQLQQVILNLLRNASDAMTAVTDRPRQMTVRTETDGDNVLVSVQDSGTGFDPENAKKLFESFFTTKQEGMGIGLSVSRSIVETHRGRLWAVSNDGPGATFAFSIPLERVDGE